MCGPGPGIPETTHIEGQNERDQQRALSAHGRRGRGRSTLEGVWPTQCPKNPDMDDVRSEELLFRLQSAAEQAVWAYWESVSKEDAEAELGEV